MIQRCYAARWHWCCACRRCWLVRQAARGLTVEGIMATARSGVAGTSMPPFGNAYTLEQLHDVASHVVSRVLQ